MIYTHTTNLDNLYKILDSGKIKSVRHIAKDDPHALMDVESYKGMRLRNKLPAIEALERLKAIGKNPDKIFLTRAGKNSNYGDIIIEKDLVSPKEHKTFNFVPNEYTIRRPLSIKHKAVIYAPDKYLDILKEKYKHIKFKSDKEFKHEITIKDRFMTLLNKLSEDVPISKLRKELRTNKAFYAGSTALGTNIDKSDIDVFIPYSTERKFRDRVKHIQELYPNMQQRIKPNKVTFSSPEMDLVVGYGDNAINYARRFKELQKTLTEQEKNKIKEKKAKIKNSWFFPELRYKMYKKQVAKDLGLKQYYF